MKGPRTPTAAEHGRGIWQDGGHCRIHFLLERMPGENRAMIMPKIDTGCDIAEPNRGWTGIFP
jgi:hypothetical protein